MPQSTNGGRTACSPVNKNVDIAAALSLNAALADGTPSGLTTSYSVLDSHFPTAANAPIWLDAKVTNSGSVAFWVSQQIMEP
jgi:hypothetical protein